MNNINESKFIDKENLNSNNENEDIEAYYPNIMHMGHLQKAIFYGFEIYL